MAQTETATGRVAEQAERLRTELRKFPLITRLEKQGKRAARGLEQQLDNVLDRLPIATKRGVERAERQLTELTRRVRELEKTRAA